MQILIQADFHRGEIVIAAAEGEAFAGNPRVIFHEEIHDLIRSHGGLVRKALQLLRHDNRTIGGSSSGKKLICTETGAGAVCAPLMLQKARIGVKIAERCGVRGSGSGRTVFRISAVKVLRPKTVKHEGAVRSALGRIWVGVAEFRRPREVEKVVIEAGSDG